MTTTCSRPGRSSPAPYVRPSCASTPSRWNISALVCRTLSCSGLSCPVIVTFQDCAAATDSNERPCSRQSRKFAGATGFQPSCSTVTSRDGSRYGSGRSSTALTTEKIAVFAPMPSASVSTATAVKPGFLRIVRTPNLTSCIRVSTKPPPFTSLHASFTRVQLPKLPLAARAASSGVMPRRTFSSARIRRWKRNSSSNSRSTRRLRRSPRARVRATLSQYITRMTFKWPA
jgi:hypothetical protein